MRNGRSVGRIQERTRAVVITLLAFVVMAGCKKNAGTAGPPPGAMAATVVATEVKKESIAETLAVVGSLAANEFIEVKAETDGTIAEILFDEGQPVKKGDLLIRLDESKFAAGLAEAEANLKLSRTTFERNQQLFRDKLVSQQEFDQAASLYQANLATVTLRKRQLQDARIYAPFSGIVGARNVSPGQVISKNTTLTWLVDLETVKAEFNVPERFLSQVKPGQSLDLGVAAYPKKRFRGEVYFLAPQVDPATRTILMKARIPNHDQLLKPGMFANLDLTLTLRDETIVVPEAALMMMGDRTSVYVVGPDNTAQIRPVVVGLRLPNQLEILKGLQPGEKVVVEGVQKVRPGGPLKLVPPAGGVFSTNVAKRS